MYSRNQWCKQEITGSNNKPKSWFLRKINKTDTSLFKLAMKETLLT